MGDLTQILQELAQCEQELEELGRKVQELPRTIEGLEQQAADARAVVENEHEAITELERRRRAQDSTLQDLEEQRNRYRGQTASVKTNEEYHALLREIDAVTAKISDLEEESLVAMDELDSRRAGLHTLEPEQAEVERGLLERASTLREELERDGKEIVTLERQRETIVQQLPPEARQHYRRVQGATGRATSRVSGRTCASCYRDVPWEIINRLNAGELHTCSSCNRFLVMESG